MKNLYLLTIVVILSLIFLGVHIQSGVLIILEGGCSVPDPFCYEVQISINGEDSIDTVKVYNSGLMINPAISGFFATHYFYLDSIHVKVFDNKNNLLGISNEKINYLLYKKVTISLDERKNGLAINFSKEVNIFNIK